MSIKHKLSFCNNLTVSVQKRIKCITAISMCFACFLLIANTSFVFTAYKYTTNNTQKIIKYLLTRVRQKSKTRIKTWTERQKHKALETSYMHGAWIQHKPKITENVSVLCGLWDVFLQIVVFNWKIQIILR